MLELKSRVGTVRQVPAGAQVSYGGTFTLERDSRLAVIPAGYGDGYRRAFSNELTVLFDGQKAPIVGRVCMDMCMVDVTDIPSVEEGSVAILYGSDGKGEQSVEMAANLPPATISYELLVTITKRIPRVYL